ncbi:MAG: hypothetical protein V2I46_01900 [Bacteroides sp.]|jgi:hypothetical protein|nr:hypothetical protein [Bacteroides sp.]
MSLNPSPLNLPKVLESLIEAAVGNSNNYQLNFWGQGIMGAIYSLGLLPFGAVGLLLGFILPGIWVFCTYRLVRNVSEQEPTLPFPKWMRKDPGNVILILVDLVFLAIIWTFILTGILEKTWIKLLFTVAFPLLTLSLLRNLLLLLQTENTEEKED